MSYLLHLKRTKHCPSCRWMVKRDSKDRVTEVKLVYLPSEYTGGNLLNQENLIKVLEDERTKK